MAIALTDWQLERAIKWFEKGLAVTDIAIILGRSEITVATALQLAGAQSPLRLTKQGERDGQYQEGFGAGYRLAITHANLHSLEAAHKHWRLRLLSWVRDGTDDVPPELLRVYSSRSP